MKKTSLGLKSLNILFWQTYPKLGDVHHKDFVNDIVIQAQNKQLRNQLQHEKQSVCSGCFNVSLQLLEVVLVPTYFNGIRHYNFMARLNMLNSPERNLNFWGGISLCLPSSGITAKGPPHLLTIDMHRFKSWLAPICKLNETSILNSSHVTLLK